MIPVVRAVGKRVVAGSSWTPASLTGLGGWWDASDASSFTYSSGSIVSQWNDKSGLGRHMTQGTVSAQPSRSGTIGGKSAVLFDGTDDGLTTGTITIPSKPASLLLVARNTAASGQRDAYMSYDAGSADGRIFRTSTGTVDTYQGNFLSTGASWGTTAAHSVALVLNGASSKIALDSGAWVNGDAGLQSLGERLSIGSYKALGGEAWQGEICEAVFVAAGISDADKTSWFGYCATKWGTP